MKKSQSTILVTLAELMRANGTVADLTARLGNKKSTSIGKQLQLLKARGLAYIADWKQSRGPCAAIFAAQTTPYEFQDAPRPRGMTEQQRKEKAKLRRCLGGDSLPDADRRLVRDPAQGVTRHYSGVQA